MDGRRDVLKDEMDEEVVGRIYGERVRYSYGKHILVHAFVFVNRYLRNVHISFQIFVHTSMDTLYHHVSKDSLPKDFGGNLDSVATYHSEFPLYTSTISV
jgi:hypothetical protein